MNKGCEHNPIQPHGYSFYITKFSMKERAFILSFYVKQYITKKTTKTETKLSQN